MDGYEVAGKLRRLPDTANAMIVAVTGYSRLSESSKSGFDAHLVKPADFDTLMELLARARR
jgi:CheY-like chemotaxis protein